LTPDAVSAVLADFQKWLTALAVPTSDELASGGRQPPVSSSGENQGADAPRSPDLHTLLGQFVAVRHEVNLQTRAVRAQQEQNSETLRQLTAALDALRQSQSRGEQAQQQAVEESIRPLVKTLLDLYDALAVAGREVQRLRETVQSGIDQLIDATTTEAPVVAAAPRSFWASLFRPSAPDAAAQAAEGERRQQRERLARQSGEHVRQMLASLVTGYTMSLQRVERALRQHGLEAIPTTGVRFDPERMEVVEAVMDSGRPAGEVIDEVRRGYLWNGRVFRYAQVRVAKS
jgi:molecular chaperone GrpE